MVLAAIPECLASSPIFIIASTIKKRVDLKADFKVIVPVMSIYGLYVCLSLNNLLYLRPLPYQAV